MQEQKQVFIKDINPWDMLKLGAIVVFVISVNKKSLKIRFVALVYIHNRVTLEEYDWNGEEPTAATLYSLSG